MNNAHVVLFTLFLHSQRQRSWMLWNEGKRTIQCTTSAESCASSPPVDPLAGPRQHWSLNDSTESFESQCRSLLSSSRPYQSTLPTTSSLPRLSSSTKTRVPASYTRVKMPSPSSPKLVRPPLFY